MKKEYDFKISVSPEVGVGEFLVARVKKGRETLSKFGPNDINIIFKGESSNPDLLFGWGIARNLSEHNQTCLIIFNPEEKVSFPNNCNE